MKLLSLGCVVASAIALLSAGDGVAARPLRFERRSQASHSGGYAVAPAPAHGAGGYQSQAADYSAVDPMAAQLLCLVNKERRRVGVQPVSIHPAFMRSALEHSMYQARVGEMTHSDPENGSAGARLARANFRMKTASENIAEAPAGSAETVFKMWCGDASHYGNMVDPDADFMGVSNYKGYWTQDFGSSLDKVPASEYMSLPGTC
ncbi:hypothetical protein H4R18_000998 [Coemansia javaensis]|uniref:SCP domain-containing protein n=1 Tax=Coemansia javaensis TaxID=2761396 RepID=A0A9W8LM71_9FUNG|nr:hypothetical protein H4R18_000998 [Coemansia javaensis]